VISVVIVSKDEPALDGTLANVERQAASLGEPCEIVVVDASGGRLDDIGARHAGTVSWLPFCPPADRRISIPQQRNAGVRAANGDVIVFTDAGCTPEPRWLASLVAPLRAGEHVTAGVTFSSSGRGGLYDRTADELAAECYLPECPSINMAFRREAFDAVGGFDERFAYGSDIDFSWRLNDAGYRIRRVADAVVRHDWGSWRRQVKRSYSYGKARARLYRKHRGRLKTVLRTDPMVVVYPAFLLGLPLTLVFPLYPALLLIPAWRNRSHGWLRVLVDHLTFGLGVLAELAGQ
jgi:cellulose synthase/poly-beta-1,6-N-acetylglucosamine synthase-like glycosyltransferase